MQGCGKRRRPTYVCDEDGSIRYRAGGTEKGRLRWPKRCGAENERTGEHYFCHECLVEAGRTW